MKYADDFIISGSSFALLEQEVKPLVEQFLRERGLELSPEKPASHTSRTASIFWAKRYVNTRANF